MTVLHDTALQHGTPGASALLRPWVLDEHGQIALDRSGTPDHFAVLGLPRRLGLDAQHLDITFRSLVRELHPDRFARQGAAAVAQAQRHTSLVNDAYRTLRHFEKRVAYVLEFAGDLQEERFHPPAELLTQVFDLNEAIEAMQEARGEGDADGAGRAAQDLRHAAAAIRDLRAEVTAQMHAAAARWDAAQDAAERAGQEVPALVHARTELRSVLGHARYLDNLLTRLDHCATL